ncbi:MAG: putative hemolysin [Rhodoferax sp.]
MPNPASVHCEKVGGTVITLRKPDGEVGMCRLPSGSVCGEWALFRGECPTPPTAPAASATSPASAVPPGAPPPAGRLR